MVHSRLTGLTPTAAPGRGRRRWGRRRQPAFARAPPVDPARTSARRPRRGFDLALRDRAVPAAADRQVRLERPSSAPESQRRAARRPRGKGHQALRAACHAEPHHARRAVRRKHANAAKLDVERPAASGSANRAASTCARPPSISPGTARSGAGCPRAPRHARAAPRPGLRDARARRCAASAQRGARAGRDRRRQTGASVMSRGVAAAGPARLRRLELDLAAVARNLYVLTSSPPGTATARPPCRPASRRSRRPGRQCRSSDATSTPA